MLLLQIYSYSLFLCLFGKFLRDDWRQKLEKKIDDKIKERETAQKQLQEPKPEPAVVQESRVLSEQPSPVSVEEPVVEKPPESQDIVREPLLTKPQEDIYKPYERVDVKPPEASYIKEPEPSNPEQLSEPSKPDDWYDRSITPSEAESRQLEPYPIHEPIKKTVVSPEESSRTMTPSEPESMQYQPYPIDMPIQGTQDKTPEYSRTVTPSVAESMSFDPYPIDEPIVKKPVDKTSEYSRTETPSEPESMQYEPYPVHEEPIKKTVVQPEQSIPEDRSIVFTSQPTTPSDSQSIASEPLSRGETTPVKRKPRKPKIPLWKLKKSQELGNAKFDNFPKVSSYDKLPPKKQTKSKEPEPAKRKEEPPKQEFREMTPEPHRYDVVSDEEPVQKHQAIQPKEASPEPTRYEVIRKPSQEEISKYELVYEFPEDKKQESEPEFEKKTHKTEDEVPFDDRVEDDHLVSRHDVYDTDSEYSFWEFVDPSENNMREMMQFDEDHNTFESPKVMRRKILEHLDEIERSLSRKSTQTAIFKEDQLLRMRDLGYMPISSAVRKYEVPPAESSEDEVDLQHIQSDEESEILKILHTMETQPELLLSPKRDPETLPLVIEKKRRVERYPSERSITEYHVPARMMQKPVRSKPVKTVKGFRDPYEEIDIRQNLTPPDTESDQERSVTEVYANVEFARKLNRAPHKSEDSGYDRLPRSVSEVAVISDQDDTSEDVTTAEYGSIQEMITLSHEEAATKSLVLSKRVTVTDGPAFKRQRSIRRSKTLQENIVYLSLDRCHSFDRSFRPMKGKKAPEIDLLSPFKDIEQTSNPQFVAPPPPPIEPMHGAHDKPMPRISRLIKSSPSDEFGFNLHAERGRGHFIGTVDAGGIGDRAGLKMGQRIVGVNDTLVYPTTPHKEVVALIKRSSLQTTLLVASEEVDKWYKDHNAEYSFAYAEEYGRERTGTYTQGLTPHSIHISDDDEVIISPQHSSIGRHTTEPPEIEYHEHGHLHYSYNNVGGMSNGSTSRESREGYGDTGRESYGRSHEAYGGNSTDRRSDRNDMGSLERGHHRFAPPISDTPLHGPPHPIDTSTPIAKTAMTFPRYYQQQANLGLPMHVSAAPIDHHHNQHNQPHAVHVRTAKPPSYFANNGDQAHRESLGAGPRRATVVSVESMVDAVLKQEPVPDPELESENEDPSHNHSTANHYNAYQQQQHDRLDIIEPAEIDLDDVWKNVQLPTTGAAVGAVVGATGIAHEVRVTRSSTKESAVDVPNHHHHDEYLPSQISPESAPSLNLNQQASPLSNGSVNMSGYSRSSGSPTENDIYNLSAKDAREFLRSKNRKNRNRGIDMSLDEKYQVVTNM